MRDARGVLALACVWLLPALARADDHSATAGFSLGTLLAIAAFAVLPLLLIAATSFAKLTIGFSLLRNALGAQDVPSGAVVTALAAILSAYVMTPVAAQMAATSAPATARIDV